MTNHAEHDDIRELLVPFALGELSDGELARVQRALDGSPSLRSELAAIEETSARLILGRVAEVEAPPALRGRVLDAIGVAGSRSSVNERAAAAATSRGRTLRSWSWPRLAVPALAGGFAAACIVLAVVTFGLKDDLDDANQRIGTLQSRMDESREQAKDTLTVSTHGDMSPASGQLVRVSDDRWVLLMNDVPDPGQGNSWQVWSADAKGNIRNIGQWVAAARSQALVVDTGDIRQVMVSFEHTEKPVPTPSTEPVMSVKV